jgi:UDP-N-acetylmuramoyl-L-alanyl-D-glutamate--2,6-diaminopimelate ligase
MSTPTSPSPPRDPRFANKSLSMLGQALAPAVPTTVAPGLDPAILGVRHDSRAVEPGDLFVARPGARADGASFIGQAVAKGAAALMVARGTVTPPGIARIEVDREDLPTALALAAAWVVDRPMDALDVIGITGTNGKTTTAQLLRQVLARLGHSPAVVGTLGYEFAGTTRPSPHTSPEPDQLHRMAADVKSRGASHIVIEVSSIALAARRLEGIRFRAGAFTNLSQDHLDYHGSMEAYAAAKSRLFEELEIASAAIHTGDPFGRQLAGRLAGKLRLVRFSTEPGSAAEVSLRSLEQTRSGLSLRVRTPGPEVVIEQELLGLHNAQNLLAALAIAVVLDLDIEAAAAALSRPIRVPGRLERCDDPAMDDIVVLVDYAHTPDALARVLSSLAAYREGHRLWCVFGCGGDRDAQKRPLMGEAAARGADLVIVTNDNPRGEDPFEIARQIEPGLEAARGRASVELDRRAAIRRAVAGAEPGDVVLIAGKGHETYQIIGDRILSFDDREVAREALAERRGAPGSPADRGSRP